MNRSAGARKIEVTQPDIDRAVRQDSSSCVVATAVARAIPDAVRITVDTQTIRYTSAVTGRRYAYLTPQKAQAYVVAFDAGDPIPPFSFYLGPQIPIRQSTLTDAGKRRMLKANDATLGEPKKPRKPREVVTDPAPAVDESRNFLDSYESGEDAPPEPAWRKVSSEPGAWRTPPLVFKRRHRTYGMRALRINQEQGRGNTHRLPDYE